MISDFEVYSVYMSHFETLINIYLLDYMTVYTINVSLTFYFKKVYELNLIN